MPLANVKLVAPCILQKISKMSLKNGTVLTHPVRMKVDHHVCMRERQIMGKGKW